jgi:hypothetical protein
MVLVFKSTTPEVFELSRIDSDGRKTVCTATRTGNTDQWTLSLSHPGGQSWQRHCYGPNVIDHVGGMFVSKESEYKEAKARDFRPRPEPLDRSIRFDEIGNPTASPITMSQRDSRFKGGRP